MPYNYETEKPLLFSDAGQRMFLAVRDNAKILFAKSGAARCDELMKGAGGGDSWQMLACVDRLVELGEIREIPTPEGTATQHRIYVSRSL